MEKFIGSQGFVFLLVGLMLLLAVGMLATFFIPTMLEGREIRRLQSEGIPTPARVVSFKDTGNRKNQVPEIITTLDILQEGQPTYRVDIRSLGFGQPAGTIVQVRIDPANPLNVAYQLTDPILSQ